MPGDKNAIRCQRTYGVRRHGPISQSSYQNGPLLRQQLPELLPRGLHGPVEKSVAPLPEGGEVQRAVAADGLSQRLFACLIQNVHPGQGVALQFCFPGLDSRQAGSLSGGFLPQLPGLQGKVCALFKQK